MRFPPSAQLRPSPDRVRETVFNWLQHDIATRRCLDLFAGSGALGLEALSRGAARVVFVDHDRAAIEALRDTLERFGAQGAGVHLGDARRFLRGPAEKFDVVFLDPPFAENWLTDICRTLESGGWLADDAHVYIECPARAGVPTLPAGWVLAKTGRTAEVGYHLARRKADDGSSAA